MSTTSPGADRTRANRRAIAVMCAGIACLVVNDAFAKWLTGHYAVMQIVFVRSLIAVPLVAILALAAEGRHALRSRHLKVHALRGLILVAGTYTFFTALATLPLAEATALIFAAPLFIAALSVPLLGERVGWRRWTAIAVGFAGVLIVVRPGAAAFQPASLYVVATAALYALAMIGARWIGRGESAWTMMFHVVLFPLLYSALVVLPVWRPVAAADLPLFLAMAVFGTLGIGLITQAFRFGQAALVAPFDYTALLWASLLGWLVWGEIPGLWTYAGAAVIVASGIFIIWREARNAPGGPVEAPNEESP